jgi:hypothetical protein
MRQPFLLATLLLLQSATLSAQYNRDNLKLEAAEASAKYSFDKLRLYPITANRVFLEAHKSVGAYKPLKEGLADGSVKIVERGTLPAQPFPPAERSNAPVADVIVTQPTLSNHDANTGDHQNNDGHVRQHLQVQQALLNPPPQQIQSRQFQQHDLNLNGLAVQSNGSQGDEVNRLFIENTSDDTLFIMAGEVVKGGKQDRVIAMDMIIPPHSAPVDMSVFCVEHGRWTYGGADAADGFTGHASVANTSVRKAAITTKNQSQVWSEVAAVTQANKASSSTGTLNSLENAEAYQAELKSYEARFASLPATSLNVIGVVAVTGGRVIGCDMFATPDLFRNAYPDLLKSYISEAITSGARVTIDNAAVNTYLSEILDESKQKEQVQKKGQMFQEKGKTMHISTF